MSPATVADTVYVASGTSWSTVYEISGAPHAAQLCTVPAAAASSADTYGGDHCKAVRSVHWPYTWPYTRLQLTVFHVGEAPSVLLSCASAPPVETLTLPKV